ncbi:hypothetical protein VH571_07285 [Frondihabitans sp. 4ASC-45]|uniref:hypothetical protein n=1 Tax=Frondihabitans sp. 4ASC-45 TaxID=3111636 RepID=UPI003C2891AF
MSFESTRSDVSSALSISLDQWEPLSYDKDAWIGGGMRNVVDRVSFAVGAESVKRVVGEGHAELQDNRETWAGNFFVFTESRFVVVDKPIGNAASVTVYPRSRITSLSVESANINVDSGSIIGLKFQATYPEASVTFVSRGKADAPELAEFLESLLADLS